VIKPRALRSGDRVGVVAPASPFARVEFEAGIAELRRLGLEPVFDEDVFAQTGFLAGEPELRARAFRRAWNDPSIAAVIAVRGGFGSVHILPLLDAAALSAAPKAFIGYSDVTSLLVFLVQRCGLVAFHGPMLAGRLGRGADGYDAGSFRRCLMQPEPIGELTAPGVDAIKQGSADGVLCGGTLTQLLASLATPFAFDPPAGCVLFLDEVGERPYRIDRMLTQLRLSGLLDRARAVVFGELPDCDEPGGRYTARSVIADRLRDFAGPVLAGFPSGHCAAPAMTLPFGVRARVVGNGRPRLVIEESAVRASI
jgi:muramoyltetrapeptide carboxypeptidase